MNEPFKVNRGADIQDVDIIEGTTQLAKSTSRSQPSEKGSMADQLSRLVENGNLKTVPEDNTLKNEARRPVRGGRRTQAGPNLAPAVQKTQEDRNIEDRLIKQTLERSEGVLDKEAEKLAMAYSSFTENVATIESRLKKETDKKEQGRLRALLSQAQDHLHVLDKIFPKENGSSVDHDADVFRSIVGKFQEYEGARRRQTLATIKSDAGKGPVDDVAHAQSEAYALHEEIASLARKGEITPMRDAQTLHSTDTVSIHTGKEGAKTQEEKEIDAQKFRAGNFGSPTQNIKRTQGEMDNNVVKPATVLVTPAQVKGGSTKPNLNTTKPAEAAPVATHERKSALTKEALELVKEAESGHFQSETNHHLLRIAQENDLNVSKNDTARSIIIALQRKDTETPPSEDIPSGKIAPKHIKTPSTKKEMTALPNTNNKPMKETLLQTTLDLTDAENALVNEFEGNIEAVSTENKKGGAGAPREGQEGAIAKLEALIAEGEAGKTPEAVVKETLETLSPEERKNVALGLENIGFYIEEKKNKLFAGAFDIARTLVSPKEKGTLDRWLLSFSENMTKNAEASHKKMEDAERTSMTQIVSLGSVTGTALKYGRVFTDLFGAAALASPLRYVMMGGMVFGEGLKAGKEARFKNEEVVERTRIQDIDAAAEEAWKIYTEASAGKEKIDSKDLEKAYMDNAPQDILNRLKDAAEPNIASGILESLVRKDVSESLMRINAQLERVDTDISLDEISKKIEREKIIQKYEQHIKDLDRAVSQFGTVDMLALGAKYGETAAKTVVAGMMVETLALSIDKLWEKMPEFFHNAPAAVPVNISNGPFTVPLTSAALMMESEKITNLATIQKGEGVENALIRQLMYKPENFGFKGDVNDASALKAWAGRTAHLAASAYTETGVATSGIGNAAYVLEKDASGALKIVEELKGADGKFRVMEGGQATMNSYEYERPTPGTNDVVAEAPANIVSAESLTETPARLTSEVDLLGQEFGKNVGGVVPKSETEIPSAPAEKLVLSPSEATHTNAMVEAGTMKGTFQYSTTGEVKGFKMEGSSSSLDGKKLLNKNLRQLVGEHSSAGMLDFNINTINTRATMVAGYEKILEALEQKGQGESPEAKFLEKQIYDEVFRLEDKYGNIFKNIDTFDEALSPAEAPEGKIISPASPEAIKLGEEQVRADIKLLFGKEPNFFGFGGNDGMDTFNKYANEPIEEILNMNAVTEEDTKAQLLANEAIKQTGVAPTGKFGDYLQNAAATNFDKLIKNK